MMAKNEYIREHLSLLTRLWLRRACLWGCALFLVMGLLDIVATPENFGRFMVYRVLIASLLLTGYVLAAKASPSQLYALGITVVTASAVTIELMILQFGGHESPYYVGMILLGISVVGFIPARFWYHMLVTVIIYAVYVVPLLMSKEVMNHVDFSISNVFIVAIFATMLVMRFLGSRALVQEYGLRYDLEQYRMQLEEAVASRTMELARAVENMEREIDERKRAEYERERLQEQFLQSQKMESIGRLAGGVAHDFNNILTAILSYAELSFLKLPPGDPVRGYMSIIQDAGEKAAALTHQLLAFSRKQILEMHVMDLNTVVKDISTMIGRLIGEDVILDLSLGASRAVRIDKTQIQQVLLNLAVNARDAMPAGGYLRIETADVDIDEISSRAYRMLRPGSFSLMTVSDTGIGMSEEVQARIFEPFFTTKARGKGTGLGLATVYGIVKQHNGYINAESEPGKGTVFRIYLPVAGGPGEAPAAERVQDLPRGNETVLLVEDEPTVRTLVQGILQSLGYRVLAGPSAEEALAASLAHPQAVELLLTDVVVSGLSGREIADRMRKRYPNIAVLFMTGYTADAMSADDLAPSGSALLHKPVTPAALAGKVREVLDHAPGKEGRGRARDPGSGADQERA